MPFSYFTSSKCLLSHFIRTRSTLHTKADLNAKISLLMPLFTSCYFTTMVGVSGDVLNARGPVWLWQNESYNKIVWKTVRPLCYIHTTAAAHGVHFCSAPFDIIYIYIIWKDRSNGDRSTWFLIPLTRKTRTDLSNTWSVRDKHRNDSPRPRVFN